MNLKTKLSALAASIALIPAGTALAASDGSLGTGASATSQGTAQVNLSIPAMIKISKITDLQLDQNFDSGTSELYDETSVCVFRKGNSGAYTVTASSANPDGSGNFQVDDGGTKVMYNVQWSDSAGNTEDLTENATSSTTFTGNTGSADCGGATNATVRASVPQSEWEAATASAGYNDTLTMMVTAN